jgi:hypothetical protein
MKNRRRYVKMNGHNPNPSAKIEAEVTPKLKYKMNVIKLTTAGVR